MSEQESVIKNPWQYFIERCKQCDACGLARSRTRAVVWRGSVQADLLILGEGPGQREDELGLPFVGRSGELLDTLLEALEIGPEHYHIANIVKCRPPDNREPTLEEAKACRPLLNEQFKFVRPTAIALMGGSAYKYFTGDFERRISQVRGRWIHKAPYWIMPTFHPAYVLRNSSKRAEFWDDMFKIRDKMEELGLIGPIKG